MLTFFAATSVLQLVDLLVDDALDFNGSERIEVNDRVEAIAELRRKGAFERAARGTANTGLAEAEAAIGQITGSDVRRHDEDHVPKVGLAAVRVG